MLYSLWLQPNESPTKAYFEKTIASLADKYDGPNFEPHLTLLGNVEATLPEIKEKCQTIAQNFPALQLTTGTVDYSTTYFQCVFIRIEPTPELMALYEATHKTFGQQPVALYMPHMSLFYGNSSYEKREEIKRSLQWKNSNLPYLQSWLPAETPRKPGSILFKIFLLQVSNFALLCRVELQSHPSEGRILSIELQKLFQIPI